METNSDKPLPICPCKGCTLDLKNDLNHHTLCDKYQQWKAEKDANSKKYRDRMLLEHYEVERGLDGIAWRAKSIGYKRRVKRD